MPKQMLQIDPMNLGGRIAQRLKQLGWTRNQLLDKVDGLTAQALSNLIVRDSRRSEWDAAIANALGVSVTWLVYGDLAAEQTPAIYNAKPPPAEPQLTAAERDLIQGFRSAPLDTQAFWLNQARYYIELKRDLGKRSEQ